MSRFHAGKIMAAVVDDLQNKGVKGLDVDGHFDVEDPDQSRAEYALAELDLVEVEELPEYAEIDLSSAFKHIFDTTHRAFNAGRTATTYLVKGDGYPNLPVGSRMLKCQQRRSWSFSMEFYVITPEIRKTYLADQKDKAKRRRNTAVVVAKRRHEGSARRRRHDDRSEPHSERQGALGSDGAARWPILRGMHFTRSGAVPLSG